MDPGDHNISLDTFNSWKVQALKEFLSKRGLSTDGTKAELAALCFASNSMKIPMKVSDSDYVVQLQKEYSDLLHVDGKLLPDPLHIGGGWQDEKCGMSHWPLLFLSDIINFLIDRGNSNTIKSYLNDYKVGKAYEYFASNFIKEIFYHSISPSSPICFLRAKCTPSQRIKDESHSTWIALCKETGNVKSAYCSCTAGMGQTCNHVAALMFRVESANKLGLTSCTSLPCQWKVPGATRVVPVRIKELNVRKSRHGQVKTRPLVSCQKTQYRPQDAIDFNKDALIDDLREALPNACLFKALQMDNPAAAAVSRETVEQAIPDTTSNITTLDDYVLENMAKKGNVQTTEDFIHLQSVLTTETVNEIQEKTIGQNANSYWHKLRKGRITASNFYMIYTRMNSYHRNPQADMTSCISTVIGTSTPNPNIKALKFGREMEPLAKDIYCKQYQHDYIKASFQDCGIFLDAKTSYLAASPDMLVSCNCCGDELLEVKTTLKPKCNSCTSFCTCTGNLPDYVSIANGELEIKNHHRYFCQIQGQMDITKRRWCDLFIYSCNGTVSKRVYFQEQYYADVQENLLSFFKMFIAPRLLTEDHVDCHNSNTSPVSCENEPMEVENSGGVYFCIMCKNQVLEQENIKSFGQRSICCDLCGQWFHFKCMGISKSVFSNLSSWLCHQCRTCVSDAQ